MRLRAYHTIPTLLIALFAVLPLVLGIGYALLYSFGVVGVLNHGFTWQNWVDVFATNEVLHSFFYTILLSLVSLGLCVGGGIFLALLLGKKLHKGVVSYAIYLPMAFPAIVAAFFFFQFLSSGGFLSRIFYKLGITKSIIAFPNLVNDVYSIGIITAQFFLSVPIFILLYASIIKNENLAQLQNLSATLGANKWQIFLKVTLPVLIKKSMPTIVLFFIFKLGSYEIPLLLGRSSPETVSVLAVRKLERFNLLDIPQGYAVAVLYTLVIFSLLAVSLKPAKISANA